LARLQSRERVGGVSAAEDHANAVLRVLCGQRLAAPCAAARCATSEPREVDFADVRKVQVPRSISIRVGLNLRLRWVHLPNAQAEADHVTERHCPSGSSSVISLDQKCLCHEPATP